MSKIFDKVIIFGTGNTSNSNSLRVNNSAGTQTFIVRDDGKVDVGFHSFYSTLDYAQFFYNNSHATGLVCYSENAGNGIVGFVNGANVGVYGIAPFVSGLGAYGVKGDGYYGVYGQGNGTNGIGVYANGGNNAYGLWAETTSGIAGYFNTSGNYALITGAGLVGLGISTPTARLNVKGVSSVGSNYTAIFQNSANVESLYIGDDGTVNNRGAGGGNTYSTAFGGGVLLANTSGQFNTGFGSASLQNNTSGVDNTSVGFLSMQANTGGNFNTSVGSNALKVNTSGRYNTAIGYFALPSNILGWGNTAIGQSSLFNTANGASNGFNTGLGYASLYLNTSGLENTASGYNSMYSKVTGDYNSAYGSNALYGQTSGDQNSAFGAYALYNVAAGASNTACGQGALYTTTGSGSVGLGFQAGRGETGSNRLYIDNQNRGSESNARTKALIYGIFDSSPSNQYLTINGHLTINDGTQGVGKVLTSDSSGNTSWQVTTFTGNTSASCITNLYVSNLNSCSPLHIQPTNLGDVLISENGGKVGIGISAVTATLHIKGVDATQSNYSLKVNNNVSNPLLSIRNDGKVGIGTDSPTQKLQVGDGTETNNFLRITADKSNILIGQNDSSTFFGITGNVAIIENESDNPFAIGSYSDQDFILGSSNNERIRIKATTGYVGIGTSNATQKLQVGNGSSGSNWIRSYANNVDIFIGQSSNTIFGYVAGTVGVIENEGSTPLVIGTFSNNDLLFGTNNIVRGVFKNDGKFGIGENNPTAKLHVNGVSTGSTSYTAIFKNSISANTFVIRDDRNIAFLTESYGSGVGVISIGETITAPTTNPTGATDLYTENGVLKYRDTSGNIITI